MLARALGAASAVVMVVSVAGCGPKPEPTSPLPVEAEEPRATQPLAASPWSECHEGFVPTGDPEADLGALAKTCAMRLGQRPLTPVRAGIQAEADAVDRFSFQAGSGGCVRVIVAAENGVRDVDVQMLGADGRVLASDASHGSWAIVPEREPLCLKGQETAAIEVSVYRGSGKYALQVWTGDRR